MAVSVGPVEAERQPVHLRSGKAGDFGFLLGYIVRITEFGSQDFMKYMPMDADGTSIGHAMPIQTAVAVVLNQVVTAGVLWAS